MIVVCLVCTSVVESLVTSEHVFGPENGLFVHNNINTIVKCGHYTCSIKWIYLVLFSS